MIGTLIWVGDTTAVEFRRAVEYCLLNVAQIAFRRDVSEANSRLASDVRWIIFARSNRQPVDEAGLQSRYPAAKVIHLLGPLCQGHRRAFGPAAFDWHQWDEVLPSWLGLKPPMVPRCQTIVVVAATLALAEPLMELAESFGATAIWSRHAGDHSVRNVDAVWWDDSIATPTSAHQWRLRTKLFSRRGRPVQHAWVTHSPRIDDHQNALLGGISTIAGKPLGVNSLLSMLPREAPLARTRAA